MQNTTFIRTQEENFIKRYYLKYEEYKNSLLNTNIKKSNNEINTFQVLKPNSFVREFYTNLRGKL